MCFVQLEGRLAETELSLRASEEDRARCAQELRASEEQRFRQAQDVGTKLSRAEAGAATAPSTSELAVQAARFEAERFRWQLEAEDAHHSEESVHTDQLVFQLEEQLREMTENETWYRSIIPRAVLRTYEPEEDHCEDPEVMSVPGDFEFNGAVAYFDPPPPGLDTRPNQPQHFQMHKEGEWERELSAEDEYSEWFREEQKKGASGKRSLPVSSPPPPPIKDFMMRMATMLAEAMKSAGFGEKLIRELDSVKAPGFPKLERFAEWENELAGRVEEDGPSQGAVGPHHSGRETCHCTGARI